MRKVICTILLLVFWASSCNSLAPVSSAVNELQLEDYAPIVTECNIALYSIMRYVLVDANEADSAKLKSLAPSFSKLVSNFGKKLTKLQSVTPAQPQYRPYHRLFVKYYAELYRWSKKTGRVFRAGDSDELTQQVILAKYMLRNLSDILRAFTEAAINLELIKAAWGADTAKVKQLVKQGADLNAKDSAGETILMFAASWGHAKAVKALIDAGADVNAKDNYGETALMKETRKYANTKTVKILIDAGADVNAKDNYGSTALIKAASYFFNTQTVKVLIDAGADVNAKDKFDWTALLNAEVYGHTNGYTNIAKVLIDAGAKASNSYNALLVQAAQAGDTAKAKQLVKQGADVNAKNSIGETILMFAASSGHAGTVKALIDAGADVNAKDGEGRTPLYKASSFGRTETVKALIDASADVNAKKKYGWTALMEAADSGHTDTVKALIAAGADVNAKDGSGDTALMEAADSGHTDTAKALIDAGADVNAKDGSGDTALMGAAGFGRTDSAKALIDAGADVNAKNEDGETVLMRAASWFGNWDIMRLLKQAGAKGHQTVSEEARRHMIRGQAAVEIARTRQDYQIAIQEFEQAAKFTRYCPEIYYNLGMVQKEAGKYQEAIRNLKKYLALAPDAKDAKQVRYLIYKIELLKERRLSR